MTVITSRQNPRIKTLIKLKKGNDPLLFIEGKNLINMALDLNLVEELFGISHFENNLNTTLISKEVAEKLSEKQSTDGYFALIRRPSLSLDLTKNLVYLDNINDPGNLGTIMRTALAFNFGGLLYSPHTVNLYNPKVLSGGQGAHFLLPTREYDIEHLKSLKNEGYNIIVSTLETANDLTNLPNGKSVIVLGNEARGVSKEVAAIATHYVKISIANIDSLNVAIAGAILMHEINKLPL